MNSDEWRTPDWLKSDIYKQYNIVFDCCPCPRPEGYDALNINWDGNTYCNPPYTNILPFILKGLLEIACGHSDLIVFLLPCWTDTDWFQYLVVPFQKEIIFLKDRLNFKGVYIENRPAKMANILVVFKK
jgi:hypothetical protein